MKISGRTVRIVIMLALCVVMFLVELIVGYAVGSIALVADSFHMLSDILSLIVALYAIRLAKRKDRTSYLTYGWQRAEVLGALVNGVFLVALCFTIFIDAIERFFNPVEIEQPVLILIVGGTGLVVNIIGMFLFHEHAHVHSHLPPAPAKQSQQQPQQQEVEQKGSASSQHLMGSSATSSAVQSGIFTAHDEHAEIEGELVNVNIEIDSRKTQAAHHHDHDHSHLNMHGIFLHVLSDALGSIAVIISALIIWLAPWPDRFVVDPILSIIITFIILLTTVPLVRRTSHILLQGVPASVRVESLREEIKEIDGVIDLHDLHIWQLTDTKLVASVHLVCENYEKFMIVAMQAKKIFHSHGIHSSTLQPEYQQHAAALGNQNGVNGSDQSPSRGGGQSSTAASISTGADLEDDNESTCLLRCPDDSCSAAECCPQEVIDYNNALKQQQQADLNELAVVQITGEESAAGSSNDDGNNGNRRWWFNSGKNSSGKRHSTDV